MDELTKISQIGANIANVIVAIGTLVAGFVALRTYAKTAKLERAKWLASLYEKFYEKGDLKSIREILDCDDDISLDITKLVRDEPPEFTDYLNFSSLSHFYNRRNNLNFVKLIISSVII